MRTEIEFVGKVVWGWGDGENARADNPVNPEETGDLYPCYIESDDIILTIDGERWSARDTDASVTELCGFITPPANTLKNGKRVRMRLWFGELQQLCDTDYKE